MRNAMQLKAIIKNIAKEKHISAQLVMQNFMLEKQKKCCQRNIVRKVLRQMSLL